jgi:hypothetical protein
VAVAKLEAAKISIEWIIYMVSRRGLEGPLHPIKRRALQGPLARQKAVPVVLKTPSAFVGLASIVLLIPVPGYVASLMQEVQATKRKW